ncbi:MAG: WD40/YVTN/BNR-like repeat-containing protein, partial [Casimicrobium sp.]
MFRFPTACVISVFLCVALASCASTERLHAVAQEATLATPVTVAQITSSAWKKTSAPAFRGKQDDVYFIDAKTGWYVNGEGKLYATKDGGTSWNLVHEKKGTFFRTLAFLDEKHGFIGNVGTEYFPNVTDETPLYETRDGGVTLTEVKLPAKVKGLCAIDIVRTKFVNQGLLAERTVIHAAGRVGGPPHLLRSLDGGVTWKFIDLSSQAGPILDVKFFNEMEGFVFAGTTGDTEKSNALILKTNDGGVTWKNVYQSNRPFEITWKASFPSRDIGYVTIQSYDPDKTKSQRYVAKTTDGGNTWKEIPLVDEHAVREFGVAFVTPQIGWVGAIDGAYQTVDGGASWSKVKADDIGRA